MGERTREARPPRGRGGRSAARARLAVHRGRCGSAISVRLEPRWRCGDRIGFGAQPVGLRGTEKARECRPGSSAATNRGHHGWGDAKQTHPPPANLSKLLDDLVAEVEALSGTLDLQATPTDSAVRNARYGARARVPAGVQYVRVNQSP